MTRFRSISLKLKEIVGGKSKSSEQIVSKDSHQRTRSRPSMDFDMIDPVLILKQKKLQSTAYLLEPELQLLVDMCNNYLSHKNIIHILSYIPIDLQRFYLNPSNDKTVTSILCKQLFGYFKQDTYRVLYRVFSSVKVFLQSEALHPVSPLRNAWSLEISNYHYLKKASMDKLEHLYLVAPEGRKVEPSSGSSQWLLNTLTNVTTLKSFHCDNHLIMDQQSLAVLMDKCPKMTTLECNVNFRNRNSGITAVPTIVLGDFMDEVPFVEDHGCSSSDDDDEELDSEVIRVEPRFIHDFLTRLQDSNITSLHLRCDVINDEVLKLILANERLRSLKLTGQFIARETGRNTISSESLQLLTRLKDLITFELHNVNGIGLKECEIIAQVPSLRNLSLVNCGLQDEAMRAVFTPRLETLDISTNPLLTSAAFKDLAKGGLVNLSMTGVPLNTETLHYISSSKISSLKASGGFFTDKELKNLFDVNMPQTLLELELEGVNEITNSGLRFIKDDATNLRSLTMTIGEGVTLRGIKFLAEHANLRSLNLRKTFSSGYISGFEQLLISPTLEELNLNNIPITAEELQFLRSSNTSMKYLSIPRCELDESEAERLLGYYKNLRKLAVSVPAGMTCQEWSLKVGVFIGQYANLFETLEVYGDVSQQISWQKVLFHTVSTLQSVKIRGTTTD